MANFTYKTAEKGFELVIILDRSGSMSGKEKGMIEGHFRLMQTLAQKKNISITTILFDEEITFIHDAKEPKLVNKMNYRTGGSTSCYDALGAAINRVNQRKTDPDYKYREADVGYIYITDGEENSSTKFNQEEVKNLVSKELQTLEYGKRDFIVMGELFLEIEKIAESIGVNKRNAQAFVGSFPGLVLLYKAIEIAVEDLRKNSGKLSSEWLDKTNALTIDGVAIKKIKTMFNSSQKKNSIIEKDIAQLERIAKIDGITQDFLKLYMSVFRNLRDFSIDGQSSNLISSIVGDYEQQKIMQLARIREIACEVELDKRLWINEEKMAELRTKFDKNAELKILETFSDLNKFCHRLSNEKRVPYSMQVAKQAEDVNNIVLRHLQLK